MFYWVMKTIFIGPVVNLLFRPWVKGMNNIPESGPAVLVSNHLSFSDSIFLPLAVPRPVSFLAKSDYFNGKGIKGKLTAAFFRLANQLPMDRSGGAASASSLKAGVDVLENGGLLGIYPEGTRSPDGRLYRGKTGVAKLVLSTGVPVIPVAMIGTDKVQPIGRRIPNIRRIGIIVGEPLDFSRYAGLENDRFIQRSVTDEIMYELMRLSGQEYVDVYASTVKEKNAARKGGKAAEARGAAVRLGTAPAGTDARTTQDTSAVDVPVEDGGKLPGTVTVIGSKAAGSDEAPKDVTADRKGKKAARGERAGKRRTSQLAADITGSGADKTSGADGASGADNGSAPAEQGRRPHSA
ncbi:1-acyl-sn-glycerol-3-phosphate acyltransferase [Arthrobacter zhangbolii]|uniref:1-acyl-sn-glycerol-3-phosphate acyltransferase n=1 Tax=Arthrobacter zhangbolii TaxID=2886936 RepID=A0A9X1M6H6_9MICC|nr:lysophospholipid acyltransferase family protein [Arthrobacter zhangbolii]MCC3271921.1 1-acyl-sn-glycerol-3-phosphate acyltransferase [Arthrobacter zhangbolii]UON93261.1 1-acyl-sn-glycerol-3-phosphate acyltransferase [Arthrobacter zhangbolii]